MTRADLSYLVSILANMDSHPGKTWQVPDEVLTHLLTGMALETAYDMLKCMIGCLST